MKTKLRKSILFWTLMLLLIIAPCVAALALIGARWYGWVFLCVILAAIVVFRRSCLWRGWRKPLAVLLMAVLLIFGTALSRPDMEVSFEGTLAREGIRAALALPSMRGNGMLTAGADYAARPSSWTPPKGYTNTAYDIGVPVELLEREDGGNGKLILQLHGGAYVIGFMDMYRDLAVRYSRLSQGASVLSVDYRIAPQYTYPAALEDALTAWKWLMEQGYKADSIIVVGDSAGGNLALALVEKLRDGGCELPCAMICMSPWADMASQGESHKYNLYKDPMFGKKKGEVEAAKDDGGASTRSYRGDADPFDPYLSPVYADFTGFPPILIQVGTYEVLESDSITVSEKAIAVGVDAELTRYHGMFHMFQLAGDFLPESRQAWREVEDFLLRYCMATPM